LRISFSRLAAQDHLEQKESSRSPRFGAVAFATLPSASAFPTALHEQDIVDPNSNSPNADADASWLRRQIRVEWIWRRLAVRIDRKLKAADVIDLLSDLFILRGVPGHIRSDNGPELSPRQRMNGLLRWVPEPPTSRRAVLGRMATSKASMRACATNSSTARAFSDQMANYAILPSASASRDPRLFQHNLPIADIRG